MNIEIDLETLGTTAGAVILSIGAVPFHDDGLIETDRTFYAVLNRQDQTAHYGMYEDPKTVKWWADQSAEAQQVLRLATAGGYGFRSALEQLSAFILEVGGEEAVIWSNGASFDIAMLEYAFRVAGLPVPWRFFNTRCHRTLKNLRPEAAEVAHFGTAHNAKDDAIYQARQAIAVMADLKRCPWPDTGSLEMPRSGPKNEVLGNPVLEVLAQATQPWGLASVYQNLRLGGMEIPERAEAEVAAALHYMIGFALRDGTTWRHTMVDDLRERQKQGIGAALESAGYEL